MQFGAQHRQIVWHLFDKLFFVDLYGRHSGKSTFLKPILPSSINEFLQIVKYFFGKQDEFSEKMGI